MTSLEAKYKHLRLDYEIKPLLHRYGIEYDPKAIKADLLQLLLDAGVPLDKIQQQKKATKLNQIMSLGTEQIARDFPSEGSGEGSGENAGEGSDEGSDEEPDDDSGDGSGDHAENGPDDSENGPHDSDNGPDDGLDARPRTTRAIQRLLDISNHKDHAEKARQAGVPDPANDLTDLERRLLLEYPAADASLPTIKNGLSHANVKKKVATLVDWFASVAKSQNIPVGSALVFFDSYLSSPNLDFVAYLLNKDNYREGWYGHASSPDAKKRAAKRLDNLWILALDSAEAARTATTTTTTSSDSTSSQDFFMDVIDPYDNIPTKGKVIGIHMSKKDTLAVRLDSLSNEYPDLGRGLWVNCKSVTEQEAYKRYVAAFPTGKLSSAPESLLAGCKNPADFKLDCVFRMKWGKTYHCYGYGHPKNGDLQHPMMFSKSTLSKVFKGGATVEMLQTHRKKTGQAEYEGDDEARPETITLRAKRPVPVQ